MMVMPAAMATKKLYTAKVMAAIDQETKNSELSQTSLPPMTVVPLCSPTSPWA